MNIIDIPHLNDHSPQAPHEFGLPRSASSPTPITSSTKPMHNRQTPSSVSSTSSESNIDNLSSVSSPSIAKPAMNRINYGYELPCEFEFVGCNLAFHPADIDGWISHSVSHFIENSPPARSMCTFCDSEVFENPVDPMSSWRKRMLHIAEHFGDPAQRTCFRTDHFVLEHMLREIQEDFKWRFRHTEKEKENIWLDERCEARDDGIGEHNGHRDHKALSSSDLYWQIKGQRTKDESDRRLIYIPDIDCHAWRALEMSTSKGSGEGHPLFCGKEPANSRGCRSDFQRLDRCGISSGATALLALSSGILMSSSCMWLNESMKLYKTSAIMNKIMNAATDHIPSNKYIANLPDGVIFTFFLFGAAGVTGATFNWLRNSRELNGIALSVALAGVIASWIVGFNTEELALVVFPLMLGFSILFSCMFGCKKAVLVEQEEKEPLSYEV